MSSVCSDQHKLHHSHHLLLRDLDIPPRKLLSRRHHNHHPELLADMFSGGSPRFSPDESTLLQKFLPYNNSGDGDSDDDEGSDPYSSDHFRMYEFKVRRCTRSRSHDWTDCPFAHPGEKASRRDPRGHHYSGTVCPDYRRGGCARGDSCEFAHGVFECWLHPARYRTEACKDGKNCKRKVCFFAHTPRQLRVLPLHSNGSSPENMASPVTSKKKIKYPSSLNSPNSNHCCVFCSCHNPVTSSPTSTLLGISHFSPPMSPEKFSPASGFHKEWYASGAGGHFSSPGVVSYKEALTDLMSSMEAMNFSEAASPISPISGARNLPWVDVFPLSSGGSGSDDQQQFILSPSTPNYPSGSTENFFKRYNNMVDNNNNNNVNESKLNDVNNGGSGSDPDLGWVNELLM